MTIHYQTDSASRRFRTDGAHLGNASNEKTIEEKVESQIDRIESIVDQEVSHPALKAPTLSVVIPVFNEADSIIEVIEAVRQLPIEKQIIVVDDGSTDGTREKLMQYECVPGIDIFLHTINQGKGAALQSGFHLAEGDIVIVQDADREYSPSEILNVIRPILLKKADVVYGSRYLAGTSSDSRFHQWGNWLLTTLSNLANGTDLTDMETCYKAFRRELLSSFRIQQRRFGFEPEITAKLARRKIRILEVPISYQSRSHKEGKKIGVRDLFNAIYCIFRYAWFR